MEKRMSMKIKTSYRLYRKIFGVFFLLILLYSCRLTKIKTSCLRNKNETPIALKNKILHQIDSVYGSTQSNNFKKILGSNCISDSIIEVKVLTKISTYDLFYFDNKINLIEVRHELMDLH